MISVVVMLSEEVIFVFIPAKNIKKKYNVRGSFYRIACGDRDYPELKCRSKLEIYLRDYNIENKIPDAYVIMENPGSSSSLEHRGGSIDGPLYKSKGSRLASSIKNTPMTKTKPDITQYQIMRLMATYDWNYVLVLNLSDLRNTHSNHFLKIYNKLNHPYLSLFSTCRDKERKELLQHAEEKPVIVAWGMNEGLKTLSAQALSKLPENIRGLQTEKSLSFQYLHPWSRQWGAGRKWFLRFIDEFQF
ncbi:hypothetical protein [Paenibacillus polymyxa]|uniref:DUF1643 domain-containing protein n=1 Tax=Paenibacillus polymyxa (strain SC2) TaxID=886882 RepID=E3EKI7_PAEPS|nr:hypothetical protein [Paenibacillus polymyxa]ADO59819.2 hypothetical protein PPSC2_26080 [Paenibacillus polymyxa SC2]WPQ59947.1 hypothetical protein SKN87_27275 [Paenibacillus polymyxa]